MRAYNFCKDLEKPLPLITFPYVRPCSLPFQDLQ